MKYNIVTVLNQSYVPFGELFVASMFENIDISKINKTYIFDMGLSDEMKKFLCKFPTVEISATGIDSQSNEIHDDGWKKNTYSKTRFLLDTLIKDGLPTIMIDSDCIFVHDFFDLLDTENSDIVVTNRNREGFSKHIGSFFSANNPNKKTISFINRWIENLEDLQKNSNLKHVESPALSKTISEMAHELNILEIPENVISAIGHFPETRIIHLKSDYYAKTIEERMNLPHARPFHMYLHSYTQFVRKNSL